MENNLVEINSVRPERWRIDIEVKNAPSVVCFFSERSQCWVRVLDAASMDTLPDLLQRAKKVMTRARAMGARIDERL